MNFFARLDAFYNSFTYLDDYALMMMWAEIKKSHRAFLDKLSSTVNHPEPNPLPILMRAINSVRIRLNIKQPRWSSLRWKSTT